MESTYQRNKAIVTDILSGMHRRECANKYHIAETTIGAAIRSVIETLVEHTDIDIQASAGFEYLMEHKETILRYINEPIPTVSIRSYAKQILRETFGKYYARIPSEVAEDWNIIRGKLKYYHMRRDKISIMRWLNSEGYLVDDYASDAMLNCFYDAVLEKTQAMESSQEPLHCTVKNIHCNLGNLIYTVELSCDDHIVERRFKLEVLPIN